MRRFYVEEDDNGKEIKRKLTTFANDDLTQLSDDELETLYYESSAQFLAKAMHFMKIENELFSRKSATVSDEILINAGNNIIEAIEQVSNWFNSLIKGQIRALMILCHNYMNKSLKRKRKQNMSIYQGSGGTAWATW